MPAPRTWRISVSGSASRSRPWNNTRPPVIFPGSWRRIIENAVTDLPLPDSPTSPSVSPLRTSNDTSLTATTGAVFDSKTVRRFSTLRTVSDTLIHADFAVFAEHAAQSIRDLAHRRPGFDGRDDRRHEIVAGGRRRSHRVERGVPGAVIASRPHLLHPLHLLRFELRIDL